MVVGLGEPRHRRQDSGDRGAGGRHRPVTEGPLDELPGFVRSKVLLGDDAIQVLGALGGDEGLPFAVDVGVHGEGVDEGLDEVLLVPQ